MSGEAVFETLEAGLDPTPTYSLTFGDGTRVGVFIDDEGALAITVDGPIEDFKGKCYVTMDGIDVVTYKPGVGWE